MAPVTHDIAPLPLPDSVPEMDAMDAGPADGSFSTASAAGDSAALPFRTRYHVSEMHVGFNFAEELKARVT